MEEISILPEHIANLVKFKKKTLYNIIVLIIVNLSVEQHTMRSLTIELYITGRLPSYKRERKK